MAWTPHTDRQDRLDRFGAMSLVGFSALLGFNQVVIKVVNGGLQPVFAAGMRSVAAVVLLYLWMQWRGTPPRLPREHRRDGIAMGTLFAGEFVLLYLALDLTSVARVSVIFYSMPVWFALAAHVWLPSERMSPRKAMGLLLAFGGVAWALLDRGDSGQSSLSGDLMALVAAFCWAGIALLARTSTIARAAPATQLFWQVLVSSVILMVLAPLFGPFIRDFVPLHAWGFAFQVIAVVTFGFLFWFWLLKIYPASSVASFGFLSPMFGVFFGWWLLSEHIGPTIIGALGLVAAGLYLINRPARARP